MPQAFFNICHGQFMVYHLLHMEYFLSNLFPDLTEKARIIAYAITVSKNKLGYSQRSGISISRNGFVAH